MISLSKKGYVVHTIHRSSNKELNENLAPLYRFVQSQVGRPWNKIYSEIREFTNSNNTVQQHVLDHLFKEIVNVNETKVHHYRFGPSSPVFSRGRLRPLRLR